VLKSELKEGVTRGLYLFYGPEDYLKRHYIAEIERLIVPTVAKDVAFNLFEGRPERGVLNDACAAYPLIGSRRFIVLQNSGLLKPGADAGGRKRTAGSAAKTKRASSKTPKKPVSAASRASAKQYSEIVYGEQPREGEGGQTPNADENPLDAIIDNLPDFTCLLINESEVDRRLSIFNKITAKGLVVEFTRRTPDELEDWVRANAGRDGVQFTRGALRQFMENAGESMTEIKMELDKLLMYAAGKRGITQEDVSAVCSISLKARIFVLLDNVLAGRKKQALSELDALLSEREPPMKILSTLSNHLILLRHIKGLAAGGAKLSDVTKLMGLNQYRAEKLWKQCAGVQTQIISGAIEMCIAQDTAIKNGKTDDETALRLLVAKI